MATAKISNPQAAKAIAEMEKLTLPPYAQGKPYVLDALAGEIIYIPTSAQATRLLVTGKETDNEFAIVGCGGVATPFPVPFHYHNEAHDVFLCIKGQIRIWTNDQCRTMGPGDYASVPPTHLHSYHLIGDYSEMCGIIVPGGSPLETLVPRMKAAAEKFDLVPQPFYNRVEEQPWSAETDHKLPGELVPYFLRNGAGPNACVSGTVVRPLSTRKESAGKFTVGSIEGSSAHSAQVLDKTWSFSGVGHCFYTVEGFAMFTVDDHAPVRIGPMETVYLPKGTRWSVRWDSRYVKMYVYSSGGGIVELLAEAGKDFPHKGPHCMIPAETTGAPAESVAGKLEEFGAKMV
ncbi:hypothetical protein MKZ38_004041 [Zalerion maritima]|uniref:Cupin type-2 domain-containing protein n=1 Tax=Zalerion maritima TaxID=339359 RepID=A0AAD5RLU2_9PEZI|nr:hypothetical protein MKZ38_004041 [Zalerion maritima]